MILQYYTKSFFLFLNRNDEDAKRTYETKLLCFKLCIVISKLRMGVQEKEMSPYA